MAVELNQMNRLMDKLGYRFGDIRLLRTALTHPSYGAEQQVEHYQRLEFLGDAVLELAVSRYLYLMDPSQPEGKLTRMRAALVREESLYEVARVFEIGPLVLMSVGEERSGGRDKASILSDVIEAIIGAVFLDGGMEKAFELVERALGERLGRPEVEEDSLDFKTRLQEHLQQGGGTTPVYEMVRSDGPAHMPNFVMRVLVDGEEIGQGSGQSKRAAQQEAAHDALDKLQPQHA